MGGLGYPTRGGRARRALRRRWRRPPLGGSAPADPRSACNHVWPGLLAGRKEGGEEGMRGRKRGLRGDGGRGVGGGGSEGGRGEGKEGRRRALRLAPSFCCSFISPASSASSMVRMPRVYHSLAITAPTPCTLHSCCTTCIRSSLSIVASRLSLDAERHCECRAPQNRRLCSRGHSVGRRRGPGRTTTPQLSLGP